MKNIKSILSILLLLCMTNQSCSDFEELNISPNNTTEVAPETLLSAAIRNIQWISIAYPGNLYTQYISQTTYTFGSRYQDVNFDFNFWYADALINLETIIEQNSNEATRAKASISGSNNNQIAVAKILKSFYFHYLTDRWGPLPYSDALKGRANFTPRYDSQEQIYDGIFADLEEAVNLIDEGAPVRGDFFLNGNMDHWKKFANSIRMVAALRLSKVDPEKGKAQFRAAMDNGTISNNAETVMYSFLADANNENPWYGRFRQVTLEALSNTLVDKLIELEDARLYAYGDPALSNEAYKGMPYGINNPTVDPSDVSFPHSENVRGQDTPLPILTYAQILFSMSEAAHLGWIDADAKDLYYQAIKASMEHWQAYDPADYERYIAQDKVRWNPANPLPLLGEQKWIALFLQGYESWAEWRRTGYPNLTPAPDPLNESGQIPLRQGYPTTERDLNSENWQEAVDTWFGGVDGLDGRLWWDVE